MMQSALDCNSSCDTNGHIGRSVSLGYDASWLHTERHVTDSIILWIVQVTLMEQSGFQVASVLKAIASASNDYRVNTQSTHPFDVLAPCTWQWHLIAIWAEPDFRPDL